VVLDLLLSYGQQLTLSDLKAKMERLNDLNANDQGQRDQVENILNEIDGQINGNPMLKEHMSDFQNSIRAVLSNKKLLTEPRKRSIVSELRERVRNLDIRNHNRQ
jgi:archaellum component FlaC